MTVPAGIAASHSILQEPDAVMVKKINNPREI